MSLWRRFRQICISLRNPWDQPQNFVIYTWKKSMISARDFPSFTARSTRCLKSWEYARIPLFCHPVQNFCKPSVNKVAVGNDLRKKLPES